MQTYLAERVAEVYLEHVSLSHLEVQTVLNMVDEVLMHKKQVCFVARLKFFSHPLKIIVFNIMSCEVGFISP